MRNERVETSELEIECVARLRCTFVVSLGAAFSILRKRRRIARRRSATHSCAVGSVSQPALRGFTSGPKGRFRWWSFREVFHKRARRRTLTSREPNLYYLCIITSPPRGVVRPRSPRPEMILRDFRKKVFVRSVTMRRSRVSL